MTSDGIGRAVHPWRVILRPVQIQKNLLPTCRFPGGPKQISPSILVIFYLGCSIGAIVHNGEFLVGSVYFSPNLLLSKWVNSSFLWKTLTHIAHFINIATSITLGMLLNGRLWCNYLDILLN